MKYFFHFIIYFNLALASKLNAADNMNTAISQFKDGNFSAALQTFLRLNQQNPSDTLTQIYLAKTYYKMDKINDSYTYFTKLDLNSLDVETSYEYGQVHYIQKKYPECLTAFSRVPNSGDLLSDLASYYAGVCAVKVKQYDLANKKFQDAQILPLKLSERRRAYIEQIKKIIALQSKKSDESRNNVKQITLEDKQVDKNQSKIKRKIIKKYLGYEELNKKANVGAMYQSQRSELHGFGENTSNTNSLYFNFRNSLHQYRRKAFYGAELDAKVDTRNTDGFELRNYLSEDRSNRLQSVEKPYPEGSSTNLSTYLRGFYEYEFYPETWLSASLQYSRVLPEFKGGFGGGEHGGYIHFKKLYKPVTLGGEIKFTQNRDKNHKSSEDIVDLMFSTKYTSESDLALEAKLVHQMIQYNLVNQTGPDSLTMIHANVQQLFPLGIKIIGKSALSLTRDYVVIDSSLGQMVANSTGYNLGVRAEIEPISWLSFYIDYVKTFEKWSVHTPSSADIVKQAFEQSIPNIIDTLECAVSVNLFF